MNKVERLDSRTFVAVSEFILLFPAALFLLAVVARYLQPIAYPAQQIVTWYSDRMWTLWVLLIALPLIALFSGSLALLNSHQNRSGNTWSTNLLGSEATDLLSSKIIVIETITACVFLTIVILHMLAN